MDIVYRLKLLFRHLMRLQFAVLAYLAIGATAPAAADPDVWLPYCSGEACGYITPQGETVIDPVYDFGYGPGVLTSEERANPDFRMKFSAANEKPQVWGYMNGVGEIVIPPSYESADGFVDGFAKVERGNKFTFINPQGEEAGFEVVERSSLSNQGENFLVKTGDDWAIFNFAGQELKKLPYDSVAPSFLDAGLLFAKSGEKRGFLSLSGDTVLPPIYDAITSSKISVLVAEREGMEALFDRDGNQLTDFSYDQILLPADDSEKDNAIVAIQGRKYQLLDFDGTPLTELKFRLAKRSGDKSVDLGFRQNLRFSEGLGGLARNFKWGFIDRNGDTVIKPRFSTTSEFKHGLAKVTTSDLKVVIINREGDILVRGRKVKKRSDVGSVEITSSVGRGDPGYITFFDKGFRGLLSNTGETIIEPGPLNIGTTVYFNKFVNFSAKGKRGLLSFEGGDVRVHVPAVFSFLDRRGEFWMARFGDNRYPVSQTGELIGFSLDDVNAEWARWCGETKNTESKYCVA